METQTVTRRRAWIALPARARESRGRSMPRLMKWSVWLAALAIASLRFLWITADFPNHSRWMLDQAKFTDEGWWASAAVRYHTLGQWNVPGDYNPAVAAPIWPLVLTPLFHFTGVNIVGPRLLSVLFSVATLGILFLLVRRYSNAGSNFAPCLSILLLASSPFAFVFSRLAILDTFVIFQFCLLMLIASYADERRLKIFALMVVLVSILVLTKATAAVLLPAIGWILWSSMKTAGSSIKYRLMALSIAGFVSALIVKCYVELVYWLHYGEDFRDFFDSNSLSEVAWAQSFTIAAATLKSCMLIDNILYPAAILGVILAAVYLRSLWRNPLFVAACLAFGGQGCFLFLTQGGYAPRYFLPLLVPVIVIVSVAVAELRLRHPRLSFVAMAPIAVALLLNTAAIFSSLHRRTFQFHDAAQSIARIVNADPQQNPLILGVSASQISLMTGLPSINDVYGTEPLESRIATYRPGWYLAWNGIGPDQRAALSPFQVERVGSWHVFDDNERDELILYRLARVDK